MKNIIKGLKSNILLWLLKDEVIEEVAFNKIIGNKKIVQLSGNNENVVIKNSIVYNSVINGVNMEIINNVIKKTTFKRREQNETDNQDLE